MADCSMCGACCSPVSMKKSKQEILSEPAFTETKRYTQGFVQQFFHEVTPEEADKMYPLADHASMIPRGYHFFRCDFFNESTRMCDAHNLRPSICRGFPWYGKKPNGNNILGYPQCSYWEDVPESERPEGVKVFISSVRSRSTVS